MKDDMKLVGLDIGDQWTGIAISDELYILASPFKTVATDKLEATVKTLIESEPIKEIIVGYPITLRGTESDQTRKLVTYKKELEKKFPSITWTLWDERLTSKQAATLSKATTKEQKLKRHAVAAALILQSYLDHLAFKKESVA